MNEPSGSTSFVVRRGASLNLLARVAAAPLALAFTVITSRWLLPSGRGALTIGILAASLAGMVLGSSGAGITNAIGRGVEPGPLVRRALLFAIPAGALLALVVAAADVLVLPGEFRAVAFSAVGVVGLVIVQIVGGALLAESAMGVWASLQVVAPLVTLLATIVCVIGLGMRAGGAAAAWAFAQIITALMALAVRRDLWRKVGPTSADVAIRKILGLGLRLGLVNVVSLINYRIEMFIIQAYRGVHDVGIYSLSTSLAELVWFPSSALAAAVIAPAVRTSDAHAATVVARGVRHAYVLATTLALVLGPVAFALVPAVFGSAFEPSRVPFLLLLPAAVVFAPASVFAVYFSLRLARARYALILAALSATVTAAGAAVLVPLVGVSGAALATGMGYVVSVALCLRWFKAATGISLKALIPSIGDLSVYRELSAQVLRAGSRSQRA